MEPFTTAGVTLIVGTITYGFYKLAKRNRKRPLEKPYVDYAFSRSKKSPKESIIKVIDDTKESLDVAMFLFTNKEIATHICMASKKGICVRVITDGVQTQRNPGQTANMERFIESGIPVKVSNHGGNMHLKIMIADQKLITTGSYNYTYSAERKNDEVFVVIRDAQLAEEWTKRFDKMWHDHRRYITYSPSIEKSA